MFRLRPISILLLFCALCGRSLFAQDWKTVHDGIEHAQVQHKLANDPVKINLLRLDLTKVRLDVHRALDKAIGLETTSSIAKRKGAIAAINAGFFRLDKSEFAGDSAGILQIDGKLLSESNGMRTEILLGNGRVVTKVFFARLGIEQQMRIDGELFEKVGVNREQKENEIVIYTSEFGISSPANANGFGCVVVQNRIRECRKQVGGFEIPKNGIVISASGTYPERLRAKAANGKRVELSTLWNAAATEVHAARIKNTNTWDAVGGVPQLIKNGKIDITWEQEKASKSFVETRHPRTAVAKLKDGKFLMVTVDGRQPGVSAGMNLYELADYLLSIGAVDAMNLDGGGSTTMFLDGKVVNTPSDKEGERKVGDAILVTLRKVQEPPRK